MKVTLVGYGAMASAIAEGLKDKYELEVIGRDKEKLKNFSEKYGAKYYSFEEANIDNKIVILAVKPYVLDDVAQKLKGKAKLLISILAGKPLKELQKIPAFSYIRAMPNVAAKYAASTTAITGDIDSKELATEILSAIGKVVWVNSDDEIDMATAIIGSGPAFLGIIAEAISDGGVYCGLKRDVAIELTKGLFESFSKLDEDFSQIKNSVMSPKGTTAEGVRALEEEGVRGKIMKGIIKTYEKSKKI
ncbi:pyrroline-5-carboxylate reductase [Caminibacter pacificus]